MMDDPGRRDARGTYHREVLAALFDGLKGDLFGDLVEASRAHVVALGAAELVGEADARALLTALEALGEQDASGLVYDPDVEDLYFHLERHLTSRLGPDIAGNLQLARSRNDLDAGAHRMMARRKLLALGDMLVATGAALAARAREGRDLLIVGRTHGAPAQPTTLGHTLTAYLDTLLRDLQRLHAAYQTTNRSPFGACAFVGTAFPLDRELLARLLGFDGLVQNTHDAVAAADFVLEGEAVCAIALSQVSRFIETLRLWSTETAPPLRLDAGLVQISSMMPQKRNLVFAEHLRSRGARAAGTLMGALAGAGQAPFEDDNRASIDLIAPYRTLLDEAAGVFRVLGVALDTAAVGVGAAPDAILASGATTSEVMDTLVRRCGLSQRQAHQIVTSMVDRQADPRAWTEEMLRQTGREVTGREIGIPTEALQRALDPWAFVQSRQTAGGPAPAAIDAMLDRDMEALNEHRAWLADAQQRLRTAQMALREACQSVVGSGEAATSRP
jgi:argininosuccinate lyase